MSSVNIARHEVGFPLDRYLSGEVNAAYSKIMGRDNDPFNHRRGETVVMYFDASGEWLGWSYMLDHTQKTGKPMDGAPVYSYWRPKPEPDRPRRQEMVWMLSLPILAEDLGLELVPQNEFEELEVR